MVTSHRAISLEPPNAERTLIVVGCGRGGTSLVAGAAIILGVPMGADSDSVNHEDVELVNAAQGRDVHGRPTSPVADSVTENLRRLIQERNDSNSLWGWKDPSADLYLEKVSTEVRNPLVVFVNRDMAAIAQSEFNKMQYSIEQAYEQALHRFSRYWSLLQKLQWPTLLVSYERAALDPEALLCEMADFIGLDQPTKQQREAVKRFAATRDYQAIPQSSTILEAPIIRSETA
ncbi:MULTISPECIES: sulfotransferase domain-containing protein [unclassified Mesorhizobium]|uniref:sulfotransferase domain-containing protein n=1 Tax=unclassified Mesorhizobium TaxID=325217 RepID=UPI000F7517E5|nr:MULTISPECIES: sulfotransferase domain-containing protein [unclassified Mesorhizobium]AZO06017.1 hypothetical protein EJ068_25310 [Mesorhizobium sp. M2A.F.Ca.ET.043.02.1.1]RUW41884.1 hypothetical protein EOA37_07810 [Mesorhizobium sp. M2A.F.Ca.ET.015.02.1.1]RVC95360.1 hypothetical protein EN739_13390 [Mesorhizobium sp. M2A.F.Ca.ET.017.03.2.1]RVD08082.1 hypothetical protein EN753_15485 [Mesorhizobium sp. M2A.F.Ca.ET.029.05.1.1]RWB44196.1 MAG: hypothetical protein EOQ46_13885 [Mesorhizobium sp